MYTYTCMCECETVRKANVRYGIYGIVRSSRVVFMHAFEARKHIRDKGEVMRRFLGPRTAHLNLPYVNRSTVHISLKPH